MRIFTLRIMDKELDKKWDDIKIKAIKEKVSINRLIQDLLKEWLKKKA